MRKRPTRHSTSLPNTVSQALVGSELDWAKFSEHSYPMLSERSSGVLEETNLRNNKILHTATDRQGKEVLCMLNSNPELLFVTPQIRTVL